MEKIDTTMTQPLLSPHQAASILSELSLEPSLLDATAYDQDPLESYTDEYGVEFSPDKSKLLYASRDLVEYTVPDSVKVIDKEAFCGCRNLRTIVISDGLTIIESDAFRECDSLISVELPDSLTRIENGAFYGCSSLSSIVLPKGLTSIETRVFK